MFQKIIEQKYLEQTTTSDERETAWQKYSSTCLNTEKQKLIRESKEEQYQEGFVRDLFCGVLGYTINPEPNYNVITEKKNNSDSRKADGAIIIEKEVRAVIELKGCDTTDLSKVENQAFGYKAHNPTAHYVIISNFEKLRFYIEDASSFLEFSLFTLNREQFDRLYLCLCLKNITADIPLSMKTETVSAEISITDKFYADYSTFKRNLFEDICQNNLEGESLPPSAHDVAHLPLSSGDTPQRPVDKLTLFKKTQKLLDRILFILFCEDRGLLPENSVNNVIIDRWQKLKQLDAYQPLYESFKNYFNRINTGYKSDDGKIEIFAYNGGLFKPDDILDNIKIGDDVLYIYSKKISEYDFVSEVSVNILGHIFEHSLTEIDEITNQITSGTTGETSKRKKDGVFYTPSYITKYIVQNTVGTLCNTKKNELGIDDETFTTKRRTKAKTAELDKNLSDYRGFLLGLKICDPACGSGAFLNAAYEFLVQEHHLVDELYAKLHGDYMHIFEVDNDILEHNLFGVDINEESVEIAKLSLWLHTAKKGRKLTSLNNNIKCGNSLIDDPAIAGDKAFAWEKEFENVFANGGFDVIIGNPPYVQLQSISEMSDKYALCGYEVFDKSADLYCLFVERGFKLLRANGMQSFIMPNKWMLVDYGTPLRKFLTKTGLRQILNFGDIQFFKDAATIVCIFVTSNAPRQENIKVLSLNQKTYFGDFMTEIPAKIYDASADQFSEKEWSIQAQGHSQILEKMKMNGIELCNLPVSINYGIKTGFNDAFYIDEKTKNDLIAKDPKSAELIKPHVRGRDIAPYGFNNSEYLINVHNGIKELNIPPVDIEQYPVIKEFMNPYYDILAKRGDKGITPFNLRNCAYLEEFSKPKIMYPNMTSVFPFMYDESGMLSNDKSFILSTKDDTISLLALTAVFNSSLCKLWIWYNCPELLGGTREIRKVYFEHFPVPKTIVAQNVVLEEFTKERIYFTANLQKQANGFTRLVQNNLNIEKLSTAVQNFTELTFADFLKEIAKLKTTDDNKAKIALKDQPEWNETFDTYKATCTDLQQQITTTDNQINALVYKLYGLTEEEIKTVEGK